MKRILALLLTLAMVFSLAACGLLGGKGGLSDAVAGKGEQDDIGDIGDRDDQKEPEDKKPSGGKSSVVSVVHPDFGLKDGFIEKVDQLKDAPDGFIPISTPEEFCKIDRNPAASYILMNDIDLSGVEYESISEFTGVLNGNGYTVSNAPTVLFLSIDGGHVENLGVYSHLEESMAGFVINLRGRGRLYNCWFDGSITNTTLLIAGGIGKFTRESSIVSCYNNADITLVLPDELESAGIFNSEAFCGGLFSEIYQNVVVCNSFNSGDVRIETDCDIPMYVGGIAGKVSIYDSDGATVRLEKCFNSGLVDGALAAGIVGDAEIMEMYVTLQILECFNVGSFGPYCDESAGITNVTKLDDGSVVIYDCYNANDGVTYGIVGGKMHENSNGWPSEDMMNVAIWNCFNYGPAQAGITEKCINLETCYYLDDAEEASADGALFATVKKLSAGEMGKKGSFEGFDFDTIWQMGDDYPVFAQKTYDEENTYLFY